MMKLKSYPGHVIDANFSVGKYNSMAVLYEANWNATGEKSQFAPTASSKSNHNISTLGHYQSRVDQIRAYEDNKTQYSNTSSIYRPSSIHINNGRVQNNIINNNDNNQTTNSNSDNYASSEWDCDNVKQNTQMINPLYNHTQNNWHSSDYLSDRFTDSKAQIKRSQTVIVKQPTSTNVKNSLNFRAIDFNKDFHQNHQQHQQIKNVKQTFEQQQNHDHERSAPNQYLNYYHNNKTKNKNGIDKKHNCDNLEQEQNSTKTPASSLSIDADSNKKKISLLKENIQRLSISNSADTEKSLVNRMNCYKTMDFHASTEGCDGDLQNRNFAKSASPSKILLNPLARNKSIKINHFDMINAAKDLQQLKDEDNGKLYSGNDVAPKKEKEKKMSFSKRFYNTISAGSKLPKVFLGRSKSQRTKLDIVEFNENFEQEKQTSEALRNSSSSSTSTLSTASPLSLVGNEKSSSIDLPNITRKKLPTAPTANKDSDSFFIPRPRLIVPVHTYTRKRRTGNLAKDHPMTNQNNTIKTHTSNGKGKFAFLFTVAYEQYSFM